MIVCVYGESICMNTVIYRDQKGEPDSSKLGLQVILTHLTYILRTELRLSSGPHMHVGVGVHYLDKSLWISGEVDHLRVTG